MDYLWLEIIALVGGFYLLAKGSDGLVEGGEHIARHFDVSPLTIGLTVVAWGTSLPELVISTWSAIQGNASDSLGTVVGSNSANLGLVLGVCALILPATVEKRVRLRDGTWLIGSLLIVFGALADGEISRLDGILFVTAFLFYQYGLLKSGKAEGNEETVERDDSPLGPHILMVLIGSVMIGIGARTAMWGGGELAGRMGLSDAVVGLSIYAVGTSLPELFAGIASARRGQASMGLGNVIGSNIFNVLAALGCAAAVSPIVGASEELARIMYRDVPVALAFSVLLLVLPFLPKGGLRYKGMIVASSYLLYMGYLMSTGFAG
ncbi:MAG: calcium/sodium antiporter [Planctomycetota bacterium]|nr:calcium/sodium antiporter [Planctomycetota bacterium]